MMKKYKLYQIDAFTNEKFTGNPAGVITNAEGLDNYEMQKIARELNNSETAFIFSGDSDTYDVHVRFFTPKSEVPICGHATIAAHYARAFEKCLNTGVIKQKTGAGILPVDIIKKNEDYKIVMTQGKVQFGNIIKGINKDRLLKALNINNYDLLKGYIIQIVSTGHSKVMICVKDINILNSLNPNYDELSKLSSVINCNGYYVFTKPSEGDDILVHGRMFAPAIGINEDPVTGNANGPLGAYLVHHKLVNSNNSTFKFKAKQGEAMGRPGIVYVEVKTQNGEPVEVKVSGQAIIVFKTELILKD
ncbi:PhzF family isomerase [Clostridium felsineum]|uniref:PhzF family isomerase n=1 Tax=Clostridium felsineum TaxID=36839 RepID=UPI00214D3819|nr:PhzF family isomerase [Clostridium felsineum]MCR3757512.1 PhzF family isomerase [Clostridium felsineum]